MSRFYRETLQNETSRTEDVTPCHIAINMVGCIPVAATVLRHAMLDGNPNAPGLMGYLPINQCVGGLFWAGTEHAHDSQAAIPFSGDIRGTVNEQIKKSLVHPISAGGQRLPFRARPDDTRAQALNL